MYIKVLNLIYVNCKGDLVVRIGRKWIFYIFLYVYKNLVLIYFGYLLSGIFF